MDYNFVMRFFIHIVERMIFKDIGLGDYNASCENDSSTS